MPMELPQLEQMCERLYLAQTQQERTQVEQMLGVFGQSTEYIAYLKFILDSSSSPYAQHMAATNLLKLATEHSLSAPVRAEMKMYFLGYLDSRGASLQHFVVVQIVQLITRSVKLGWFESETHKSIVDDAQKLIEKGTSAHYLLGLRLLNTLVLEMNQPTPGRTLTQHRKVAVNFRDSCLLKVFQVSLGALQEMLQKGAEDKLKEQGLSLASQCLSFDFVGTCLDDSSEELCTIQVPSSWRPLIEEPTTLSLFLDFYTTSSTPLSNVRMASVRRSLFTSEVERGLFLNRLVNGTRQILLTKQGLAEHDNYHEFCRLLGRLKTNYQLSELVAVERYTEWIQLVADLTINSLNSWQWASSSVYYLLGLWSRLVTSLPYLKGESPSLLETSVPQITQTYITSRLESVGLVLQNSMLENMLENEDQLTEQMDALPYLVRFQYEKSSAYILSLMEPLCEAFSLSQEPLDGDLSARVFALLAVMDDGFHTMRYAEPSRQRLDTAIITFFQGFRKVYIGEQVMHSSKVFTKLQERLGLKDNQGVLTVMLSKIAKNLQVYGGSEVLVHQTLTLFQDLAAGYMSGKLLLKLDSVAYVLEHHTADNFAFLNHPANTRNRTTFYATLSRLRFMDDQPSKFKDFI
eukprot:gene3304-13331_t